MSNWLDYEKYAVFGMGRSGLAAANLLARRNKSVLASDIEPLTELEEVAAKLDDSVELVGGENCIGDAEVVVVSPGLKPELEIFAELRERNIPVISEIELGFSASSAPILAITGTDGKSTTTELAGHFLESSGVECAVGGNLGTPLCALVDEISEDGYIVAEVSAFQLWTTHDFEPAALAFTNIAADHLDYFPHVDDYIAAKKRLMDNADETTVGVFSLDDEYLARWYDEFEGRAIAYGLSAEVVDGCEEALWFDEGVLSARLNGQTHPGWHPDVSRIPLTGRHNLKNVLCAAGLVSAAGLELVDVRLALRDFEPLPHRLEHVADIGGVHFYDDSKATNAHAALAGLESLASLDEPIVAIVGGVDKGLDLGNLVDFIQKEELPVVLIGEIRERLGAALLGADHPEGHIHSCETLEEAVARAYELAQPQGVVSLSPACSSFDMFDSYAQRGRRFQEAVERLAREDDTT